MAMTLIVLAATMGNKYGGLKQLEGIGPNGETILDFSIYRFLSLPVTVAYLLLEGTGMPQ